MPGPNQITCPQLARLIGTPDCPVLVDVCLDADFGDDPYLVPGALRHPFGDLDGIMRLLEGRASIIICQKGKKLSQGVAAWLRSEGLASEALEGGMHAWRDMQGALRLNAKAVPAPAPVPGPGPGPAQGRTLWVTRHRPKIDRIACPWLIRRFVDPMARFLFVAPDEVEQVAEKFGATAFDTGSAEFRHIGEACTFDAMLDAFGLRSEALDRLSRVVRAADTNRHDLAPQAAGLLALSVGLSRQYKDDNAQLEAGLPLYDALYRWARDGFEEGHDHAV